MRWPVMSTLWNHQPALLPLSLPRSIQANCAPSWRPSNDPGKPLFHQPCSVPPCAVGAGRPPSSPLRKAGPSSWEVLPADSPGQSRPPGTGLLGNPVLWEDTESLASVCPCMLQFTDFPVAVIWLSLCAGSPIAWAHPRPQGSPQLVRLPSQVPLEGRAPCPCWPLTRLGLKAPSPLPSARRALVATKLSVSLNLRLPGRHGQQHVGDTQHVSLTAPSPLGTPWGHSPWTPACSLADPPH